ncbi:Uncharacterised protein [Bergeriella denitrificans]|uniref:SHOCT domain-containing protein n=1 Tax=Bergeriella denitrificans TaxID=494 RepID=A0A378UHE0_BERDE|nr:SHOCT domain-containing protein [Bergeriella denitrificans]STZ76560.1 Uncharacterised protein [Bergeriella denitrificans]
MEKPNLTDELVRLAELRDKGILTEEEFQQQKQRLLAQNSQQESAEPDLPPPPPHTHSRPSRIARTLKKPRLLPQATAA